MISKRYQTLEVKERDVVNCPKCKDALQTVCEYDNYFLARCCKCVITYYLTFDKNN